jgi:hypothetical protein
VPPKHDRDALKELFTVLADRVHVQEYASLMNNLFYEYFENRKYLME